MGDFFDPFFNVIAGLLAWFYGLPDPIGGSYGVAITLLTLSVMVIVTPLTIKGTRSMMTMTAMAPEMKKIQQEYSDDRQKMNEEMLAFYKENKINPVGGCLPLLLQMPVFIILYQVIMGLTRTGPDGTFNPKYISQSSRLYQDLSSSDEMISWGLDLSRSAAAALQVDFVTGLPYMIVILFVAGTAYLQQKQMSGRNPNAEMPPPQKILLRILPLFLAVISFNFALGLVLYFLVSNVYRIFQNVLISMKLYGIGGMTALFGIGANASAGATDDTTTKPTTRGSTNKADPAKGSEATGSDQKGSSGTAKPRNGAKPTNGSKGTTGKSPAKGSNGSSGTRNPRPSGGRVTPPKSSGGPATPARRRKKRS